LFVYLLVFFKHSLIGISFLAIFCTQGKEEQKYNKIISKSIIFLSLFQYFIGAYKQDEDRLFSRDCCNMTRGNSFNLREGRFRLDIKQKFLRIRVMKPWQSLERW